MAEVGVDGQPTGDDAVSTEPLTQADAAEKGAAGEGSAASAEPGPEQTPVDQHSQDDQHDTTVARDRKVGRTVRDVMVGIAAPALATIALAQRDDATLYRPGVVLLTITILIAVFVGFRAGLVATITSCIAIAEWFTDAPEGVSPATRLVSVGVFALGCVGVLLVVRRLDELRRSERRERLISDALLDGSPVGIALFDTDIRFERINSKLAEINGRPSGDHLGHRPRDFNAAAGQLYEPIIESVRDTGLPVLDKDISLEVPQHGVERHWKASYYPVRDEDGALVGVAAAVRDTTGDVIGRRRADSLLLLARDLAQVGDQQELVDSLTAFLAEVFNGRALVAFVDQERGCLEVANPLVGYPDDAVQAWAGFRFPFERRTPMCDAVRDGRLVHLGSDEEFADRYPEVEPERKLVGDASCACVPVTHPVTGEVVAVFRVGWPYQRPLTDTSRTLCATVASLVALAWNRIRLTEQINSDRFRNALDSMLDNVAIAQAVRDGEGRIQDFEIEYINASANDGAGRTAGELVGRTVLELYPRWRQTGMFDIFAAVVETGEPFLAERLAYDDELDDGIEISGYWNLQVVRFGDGYLAASHDVSELVRLEQAERDAREVAERERIAVELLQRAALPEVLPEIPGFALDAIYRPASDVQPIGGDWYDAFSLPDGRLGVVIADVSGHGAGAASFMVQVRNVFRAAATLRETADQVLQAVNEVVCGFGGTPSFFVTCCYCTLDLESRQLEWASAGHPPPIISRHDGAALAEQRPGYPLAVASDASYQLQAVQLELGDRVLLCTDGLFERRGEPVDAGLERLRRDLAAGHQLPVADILERLADTVHEPFDDLAAIIVEVAPAAP